jgi:uncharacterized RmlC-like cupin family protein
MATDERWRHDGVRVVPATELDPNTPQTPGMDRKAAITFARVGAQKLWAGTVHIHPNAKTGAHHHGPLESVVYVLKGRARMRWGERLEFVAEAGPGDFIYVPPFVPHQEINASADEVLECVLVRSAGESVDRHAPRCFHQVATVAIAWRCVAGLSARADEPSLQIELIRTLASSRRGTRS